MTKKVVLLLCLLVGVDAFPGKRIFGKLRDEIQKKRARGKKSAEEPREAGGIRPSSNLESIESGGGKSPRNEIGSYEPEEYPPGAVPLLEAATSAFTNAFGVTPELAAQAPGRVNLIGEHTDYTGGFVLPLALEKRTVVVGVGSIVDVDDDDDCAVLSVGMKGGAVVFDAHPATLMPGDPFWSNYVKGVVKQYSADLPPGKKFAFKAAYASDVPLGAGLSSSAALEVSTATFLEQLLPSSKRVPKEAKALRCQAAEHEYCGMPCGIMDQFISALGEEGKLLQIDCRAAKGTPVRMGAGDAVILVTNSNVKHALSGSEYPTRVAQCQASTAKIASKFPHVTELRDATPAMLEEVADSMDDETYHRARHVIYENRRVASAIEALESGDFRAVGRAMVASHTSLRDDFEVSCPELDTLVDLAMKYDGVYGARMTGGGFGGCIVTLVKASRAEGLMPYLSSGYQNATGLRAESFITRPGTGAGPLKPLS